MLTVRDQVVLQNSKPPIVPIGGVYRATPITYTDGQGVVATFDSAGQLKVAGSFVVDSEFPAASTLADNTANPTTTGAAAYLMAYDGSTWDRVTNGPGVATSGARVAIGTTPMLVKGTEDAAGADTYTTIITPATACSHALISLGGSNDAIISFDAGTTDHMVVPAGSVLALDGLTITAAVAIQGKNKTGGSNYTNLNISVW